MHAKHHHLGRFAYFPIVLVDGIGQGVFAPYEELVRISPVMLPLGGSIIGPDKMMPTVYIPLPASFLAFLWGAATFLSASFQAGAGGAAHAGETPVSLWAVSSCASVWRSSESALGRIVSAPNAQLHGPRCGPSHVTDQPGLTVFFVVAVPVVCKLHQTKDTTFHRRSGCH